MKRVTFSCLNRRVTEFHIYVMGLTTTPIARSLTNCLISNQEMPCTSTTQITLGHLSDQNQFTQDHFRIWSYWESNHMGLYYIIPRVRNILWLSLKKIRALLSINFVVPFVTCFISISCEDTDLMHSAGLLFSLRFLLFLYYCRISIKSIKLKTFQLDEVKSILDSIV